MARRSLVVQGPVARRGRAEFAGESAADTEGFLGGFFDGGLFGNRDKPKKPGRPLSAEEIDSLGLSTDAPGEWTEFNRGSERRRWMDYEELIIGTPAGIEYQVEFGEGNYYQADGYDPDCVDALEDRSDPGCIEEVKGPGMEWMPGR